MKGVIVLLLVVYATFGHVAAGRSCRRSNVVGVDQCPPEQEHDWTIEHLMRHENCNMFYHCVYGQPMARYCPGNLYFDLSTWRCEWPHLVDCQDRIIPPPPTVVPPTTTPSTTTTTTPAPTTTTSTTTTPAPTTTTSTTTTPAPTTTTSTTTTTTPAPTTTTSTTTTTTPAPTTTTTTTTTTPAPTTTTSTTTTTTPAPTTTTSTTTTTTPAPTTTPSTTTTAPGSLENGCPVNPHIHRLLPHEYDCNLFYYCVWGSRVLRQCPGVLHFNTRIQVCDHIVNAGCTLPGRAQFQLNQILGRG
ncbi:unnamed protein product [Arctia plantaginis]|uniref:Chitin-binding type-2 domain-containing protein n=1 Tax=Arctia plantaginis TaxID=874455 RepID=A0A8S1BQC9_ARCPL|nr:unnamed protein product [Arctia plantaginis]CAB3260609.1 unnamed protein product [Arctia plantaginis]